MKTLSGLLALAAAALIASGAEEEFVFRSSVALIRVDAQVVDTGNRAVTGLEASDFVLYEQGKPQPIRNFAKEDMPVDVLFLLDVSGSMRPQIERVAAASREALLALGKDDRVAIMVFDRNARVRMPFRNSREDIQRELDMVMHQETFDGGTDINHGIEEAASYIGRNGRRDARKAIVILTDDQTERDRDEAKMVRALTKADAVMSALLAPNMISSPRGGMGGGGGSWPGGPLGGIIFGGGGIGRGPMGGRYPSGGGISTGRTRSAGTAEIARRSGGDSFRADEADALETTLTRLRQRYALHFSLPADAKSGQERNIEVELSPEARRRYPNAEVRYRRSYAAEQGGSSNSAPVVSQSRTSRPAAEVDAAETSTGKTEERRGGWRRSTDEPLRPMPELRQRRTEVEPAPAARPSEEAAPAPQTGGGWRRVKPGEEP